MVSIRLAIVMALYGLLVVAGLVTITVVFSVLSNKAMNEQVLSLAKASVSGLKQTTVDQITSFELVTYHIAMLLLRLDISPPIGTTGQDINDYITTWNVMTVPEMNLNSTYLSTFSLWMDTATGLWYMTGCNRQTQLCSLYDASANTTQFVTYKRWRILNPVDPTSVVTADGAPPMYARYLDSLQYQIEDDDGWWGYLYVDNAQSVKTHYCKDVPVAQTIDYFLCSEYTTINDAKTCTKIVGVTVEATEAGSDIQNEFIATSTIALTSTKTVDNVDGLCNPDPDITKAVDAYLKVCQSMPLTECDTYFNVGKPYVYTVLGYSQANGVSFVIADRAPYSFFYDTIEQSQRVAIAISVVMIVLVVIMTVIITISIVVPISYICVSMKNASNLTYERQMAPITRYTVFYEVQQLCASYLDLRQALKDLKAFMPQGLLVGPDENMDSTSLLSALMGGGRYKNADTGDSPFTDGEDIDEEEEEEEDMVMQMAGRAGGYSTPDATNSLDPSVHPSEMMRRRSSPAQGLSREGGNDDDSPLPMQQRRSNANTKNYVSQNGIVSVVAVSTSDDTLARNAAIAAAGLRRQSSVILSTAPPAASPAGRGESDHVIGKRKASKHAQLPDDNENSTDNKVKRRNGYNTLNGSSSRGEGASLRLNRSVYNGDINKFRSVNCTLLCIRFFFKFIDEHSLEEEVNQLMNILIRVVLRYGGIIEVFRPDLIIVSFGAHASMSMHTQRATAAAITVTRKLTVSQRARTRIVVDTGAFYCGTCGANGRVSPVLFGDRFDDAFELLRYDLGQGRLIVTGRVALCLPGDFVVPFDYVVSLRDRSHGTQIFLVVNPSKRDKKEFRESVNAFRNAYTLASSGKYRDALEIVSRGGHFDPELAAHCVTTYKYLMAMNPPRPRYCRFQLPGFEPLGVEFKEQIGKYQHERLRLNELEAEDEEHVSINFGFGGASSSATGNNASGPGQSLSHIFGDDPNAHDVEGRATEGGAESGANVSPQARSPSRCRTYSHDSGTAVRSFAVTDDVIGSTTDRLPITGSSMRDPPEKKGFFSPSVSRAGDTGRSDISEEGLPLVFTDHKGERWHRFPSMIGSGAFAEVFKALSESGTLMALKCIHLAATNVQLSDVVMEVNTACKLFSDFIVNHVGWAHVGNYMIIIMDYMSGGSLHSALAAFPSGMTLQVARRYASDSLRGLAYLHRNGVVHADFKPQNILLAADGGCRLSDFGSSVTKANARSSGGDVFHLRGTPAYMSPEVAKGDPPSMKSDMWSFGITLYEVLTGRQPWVMKKGTGLPSAPVGWFQPVAGGPTGAVAAARVEGTVHPADTSLHAVSEVSGGKMANENPSPRQRGRQEGVPAQASPTRKTGESSVVAAPLASSSSAPSPPALSLTEWVPVQGLSDVRFVQGIANGSLQVSVDPKDLPTSEAYQLITACLQVVPQRRPISWEILDHSFFFSY